MLTSYVDSLRAVRGEHLQVVGDRLKKVCDVMRRIQIEMS